MCNRKQKAVAVLSLGNQEKIAFKDCTAQASQTFEQPVFGYKLNLLGLRPFRLSLDRFRQTDCFYHRIYKSGSHMDCKEILAGR